MRALKNIALLLLLLRPVVVIGQWYPINSDSIDLVIRTSRDDRARLHALDAAAGAWFMSDRALPYLKQGDSLTRRLMEHPDDNLRGEAIRIRATLLYNRGYHAKFHRDLGAAQRDFLEALELGRSSGDTLRMATCLDALGVTYLALHLPQRALDLFMEEADLLQALKDVPHGDVGRAFQHGAKALLQLKRTAEARSMIAQCDTSYGSYHALSLMVLAQVEEAEGDHTGARATMEHARRRLPHDKPHWDALTVLEPMAAYLLRNDDPKEALTTARECITIAAHIGDDAAWCGCKCIEGEALLLLNDRTNAQRSLQQALDTAARWGYIGLSRETGDEGSMVHAAGLLKDLHKQQGDTRQALEMTERWAAWKDSIQRMEARDAILRHDLQVAQFTDSIADAERTALATRETQNALDNERGRGRLLLLIIVVAAVAGAAFGWSFLQRRKRERTTTQFDLQRVQQEHMIRELRMREQMSQDLHEDLGAGLSALKLWCDMAAEEEHDTRRKEQLLKRSAMADELIASLRQIIWTLNSSATRLDQLVTYLTDHAHLHCAQHGLRLRVYDHDPWPHLQLSTGQRRDTFLIVREAFQNIAAHAQARSVDLHMAWSDGLRITVQDDGIGMAQNLSATTGNGIRSMQRRATSLGGSITFSGDQGTCVSLFVPLPNESSNGRIADRTNFAI